MKPKKIIYKVTCTITNEVYIGATTKSLEERKANHIQKAIDGKGHNFHDAIATYGPKSFTWEQVDMANDLNELAAKEKEYIFRYKLITDVYNRDSGGGFQKKIYQYDKNDFCFIRSFDSLEEAANAVDVKKTSISNACLGYIKSCKGYYWSYTLTEPYIIKKDLRRKEVQQMDLSGNLIAKYKSVAEASKSSGLSKTCISRVCRGERKQSGGYMWKYII